MFRASIAIAFAQVRLFGASLAIACALSRRFSSAFLDIVRAQGRRSRVRPWIMRVRKDSIHWMCSCVLCVQRDAVYGCVNGYCACTWGQILGASVDIARALGRNFLDVSLDIACRGMPFDRSIP
jgi:hypothetical protein